MAITMEAIAKSAGLTPDEFRQLLEMAYSVGNKILAWDTRPLRVRLAKNLTAIRSRPDQIINSKVAGQRSEGV